MGLEIHILFILASCSLIFGKRQMRITDEFVLTILGKGKCPDPLYVGSSGVVAVQSQLDCARWCSGFEDCICFGYHGNDKLCDLYTSTPDRFLPIPDCKLMVKRGAFPKIFPPGYVAARKMVNVTLGTLSCLLPTINNWIIMMDRFDGSVSFNRSWADYKIGFGNIRTSEFWIGNECIHHYTNQPGASYRLRVEVQQKMSGKWYYAEYATFSIDSEANNYTIHVSGYVGNAGDSLADVALNPNGYHNGMKFTTFDRDNDKQPSVNCATSSPSSSAWWYNSCGWSCLTCKFGGSNFAWSSFAAMVGTGQLQSARMMIRRNDL